MSRRTPGLLGRHRATRHLQADWPGRAEVETSTGPGPAPMSRRPSRTASAGDRLRRPRRLQRRAAERQVGGERGRVRAPGAVRRPVRVPLARGAARCSAPSKNTSVASSRWPPVTTTSSGPSACSARARSSASPGRRRAGPTVAGAAASPRRRPRSPSTRASGRFGVITVASGRSSSISAGARRRRAGPRRTRRPSRGRSPPARRVSSRRARATARPSRPCRACRSSPRPRRCPRPRPAPARR